MMDLFNLGSDARRSPVHVARCLAEMVCKTYQIYFLRTMLGNVSLLIIKTFIFKMWTE